MRGMFPRVGDGVWADAVAGDQHLRLFSSEIGLGPAAAVFNMNSKSWIAREWADDVEDGKRRAVELAKGFPFDTTLRRSGQKLRSGYLAVVPEPFVDPFGSATTCPKTSLRTWL